MIKELFIVEDNTSFQLSKNEAVRLAKRVSPSALIKLLAYISSRLSKLILLAYHSGSHRHPREGGDFSLRRRGSSSPRRLGPLSHYRISKSQSIHINATFKAHTVSIPLRVSPSSPRRRGTFFAKAGIFSPRCKPPRL